MKVQVLVPGPDKFEVSLIGDGYIWNLRTLSSFDSTMELVNSLIISFGWAVEWVY